MSCRAEQHGLRLTSSVSHNTKLLIQGEAARISRKHEKAKELQVPVLQTLAELETLVSMVNQ